MSIINEALKKTQSQLEQKIPGTALPQPIRPKKSNWVLVITTLIFVGFLTSAGIFLSLILKNQPVVSNLFKKFSLPTPAPHTPAPHQGTVTLFEKPTAAPVSEPTKRGAQRNSSPLVLNGIITMNKEELALINNQIIKEGDYINDKRVLSISMDQVELFDNGEIIVLKNKK